MGGRRQLRWGGVLFLFTLSAGRPLLMAQTDTQSVQPYASMDPAKVDYRGPGRDKTNDLQGCWVRIGILLPLQGKRAPEGKLLLQAAQIAIDEENKADPPAKGQQFMLAVEDESGPWGQASNAMVRVILQDEAVALITSTDGNIAHQAEQIANKIGIVVVTLSSDSTTTRINVPWIFRVGPSDAEQAQVMADRIYGAGKPREVLLITENGHDGRVGGEEFMKAALARKEAVPTRFEVNSEDSSLSALIQELRNTEPDVVVVWTGSLIAKQLIPAVRQTLPFMPVYLCQKAAAFVPESSFKAIGQGSLMFTVGPEGGDDEFAMQYREKTGEAPGIAAQQIREAVRAIADAVRRAGTNRARVRDRLAATSTGESIGEAMTFDRAGNLRNKSGLVSVEVMTETGLTKAPE